MAGANGGMGMGRGEGKDDEDVDFSSSISAEEPMHLHLPTAIGPLHSRLRRHFGIMIVIVVIVVVVKHRSAGGVADDWDKMTTRRGGIGGRRGTWTLAQSLPNRAAVVVNTRRNVAIAGQPS